ncbi:MAG TPA: DUF86 domain-containing protein [Massilibacterium sp.]|nr:DUF86 domain-containing protein [Massilibacterium sp.]
MYFVDRNKIEQTLTYLEKLTKAFTEQDSFQNMTEQLALERAAHMMVESMIDVGNAMIDGFIMRDPGSYEDIIDILEDETVITTDMAKQLKVVIGLRKMLVQEYTSIHHEEIEQTLTENIQSVQQFPTSIRTYLENELGPVSAFIPE